MKRAFLILTLIIIVSCNSESTKYSNLTSFIPSNSAIIIKINDFQRFKSDLKNSDLIKEFSNTSVYIETEKKLSLLEGFDPYKETLLTFSEVGKDNLEFTFITKNTVAMFNIDSTIAKKAEIRDYENKTIKSYSIKGENLFTTLIDSVFVLSSSNLLIENSIRNYKKFNGDERFLKLYNTSQKNAIATLFIDHEKSDIHFKNNISDKLLSTFKNFGEWSAVDIAANQNEIKLNGVSISNDSVNIKTISLFENISPRENKSLSIMPINFDAIISYTFSDFITFLKNKKPDPLKKIDSLFADIDEFSILLKEDKKAAVLHSKNFETTRDSLQNLHTSESTFRENEIYRMNRPEAILSNFRPLIKDFSADYYTIINNFFIFSENKQILEDIIANFQNNTIITSLPVFPEIKEELTNESSILFLSKYNKFKENPLFLNSDFKSELSDSSKKNNKFIVMQAISAKDFTYVNTIIKKTEAKIESNIVSQLFSTKLDAKISRKPQFVINHRSKKKEIVVQDINNNLYLISTNGKVLWKKKLSSQILGDIHQIDIYKNGRLQLAFATKNEVMVVDRNGDDVTPFPKKFTEAITQPLAVFDYDKNKKYRFLVVQGNELHMYDSEGKNVSGFILKNTESYVLNTPQHFRLGSKDYIVIPEENGKLNILHRTGKSRIEVKEKINFSGNDIYLHKSKFTTSDALGNLIQIDENGKFTKENLLINNTHFIDASSKTLVSLSDNVLNIRGRKIDLDYAIYTKPKIFYINNKIYVSVTDTQSNKVYLFDSLAEPIQNFPVYGTSAIDLADIDNDKRVELVVQGEDDSILVYKVN